MSAALQVHLGGVAVLGPGLADWAGAQPLLCQPALWQPSPTRVGAPTRLPANERRRAGTLVKASIQVADAACADADVDPSTLPTVFTSSTAEPTNCHALCEALASTPRTMSPTRFTNSVHNAAAGYWHIAVQGMAPSTSLAAFDASFGAGLLEAAAQCASTQAPVLLVACDLPYPPPLHALRPLLDAMAVALVLLPQAGARTTALRLWLDPATAITRCEHSGLEALRQAIPTARALPLLQALAGLALDAKVAAPPLALEVSPGLALCVQVQRHG